MRLYLNLSVQENMLRNFIKFDFKLIARIFFLTYLLVGITIFKDYGISWDEPFQRDNGLITADYVFKGDDFLSTFKSRYYGTFFELLLVLLEVPLLGAKSDLRLVFLLRHFFTFIFFYISVIFFYLFSKDLFKNDKYALLACLLLVLSPRIFAHSFYNSKDIPFLSAIIIAFYTLNRLITFNDLKTAILHALSCSVAMDIRVVGIFMTALTVLYFLIEIMLKINNRDKFNPILMPFFAYLLLTTIFTIALWPFLWEAPLRHFIDAIKLMSHYQWHGKTLYVLYMGNYLKATEIPWHYGPLWIIMTTPIVYSAMFIIGSVINLYDFFKNPIHYYSIQKTLFFSLCWFFLPILVVILLQSTLYDSWRQLFFIYPALIILALSGVVKLSNHFYNIMRLKKLFISIYFLFLGLNVFTTAAFMIKYHPYQNVYFNTLAGTSMKRIKANFDLDYWGLSYRKALEFILNGDDRKTIRIFSANSPGISNSFLIAEKDRKRLKYVKNIKEADYFVSNYRGHIEDYPYTNELFSIKIENAKIMSAFKLR